MFQFDAPRQVPKADVFELDPGTQINVYTPYAEVAQESVRSVKDSNVSHKSGKQDSQSISSRRKAKKEGTLRTFLEVGEVNHEPAIRGTAVLVSNLNYLDEQQQISEMSEVVESDEPPPQESPTKDRTTAVERRILEGIMKSKKKY